MNPRNLTHSNLLGPGSVENRSHSVSGMKYYNNNQPFEGKGM